MLYHMTLDELIEYDFDEQQAQQMIESVSDEAQARIDWNKVWSKKYPVLAEVKRSLYDSGAAYAAMSGSGSAFFAIYPR